MLRNKYILFIFLFLIGAQWIASQVVVLDSVNVIDSIDTVESIEFLDTVEFADVEFEAWLEKYAIVNAQLDDTTNISSETMVLTDSTENLQDTIVKKDFVSLSKEGEEAREREKNELIKSVMKIILASHEAMLQRFARSPMIVTFPPRL